MENMVPVLFWTKNGNCIFLSAGNAYEISVLHIAQKKSAKIGNAFHKQK